MSNKTLIISDLHVGCLDNFGQKQNILQAVNDIILYAKQHNYSVLWNGDTLDCYPKIPEECRVQDGQSLQEILHQLPADRYQFIPGNHDPNISPQMVEKYLGLSASAVQVLPPFYLLHDAAMVTHGHYPELAQLQRVVDACVEGLDIPSASPQEIIDVLNSDTDIHSLYEQVDLFYRDKIDPILDRLYTSLRRILEKGFTSSLSAKGYLGRVLLDISEKAPEPIGALVDAIANWLHLTLTYRALRMAKGLDLPAIIVGHNHVPEMVTKTDKATRKTTTYVNTGSIYQVGQGFHFATVEQESGTTYIRLRERLHNGAITLINTSALQPRYDLETAV